MSLITDDFKIKYIKRRREDYKTLTYSLENSNFAEIEKIGHQIKGNAATFEFAELAEIGANLESSAIQNRLDLLEKDILNFGEWVILKEKEFNL